MAKSDILEQLPHPVKAIIQGLDLMRIGGNDHIAAVAIHNLQQHGCRVPEDVAVIGRGNDSFDDIVTPAISTMDDGLARQGKAAFDLVRLQLENLRNGHDGEQTLLVPPEFIRRSSSG